MELFDFDFDMDCIWGSLTKVSLELLPGRIIAWRSFGLQV